MVLPQIAHLQKPERINPKRSVCLCDRKAISLLIVSCVCTWSKRGRGIITGTRSPRLIRIRSLVSRRTMMGFLSFSFCLLSHRNMSISSLSVYHSSRRNLLTVLLLHVGYPLGLSIFFSVKNNATRRQLHPIDTFSNMKVSTYTSVQTVSSSSTRMTV